MLSALSAGHRDADRDQARLSAWRPPSGPAAATHEVSNQASPLEDYNVFESDRVLVEALRREGGDWADDRAIEVGALAGRPEHDRLGRRGEREPAEAAHPRPLRQPHRRGRVPPRLARAARRRGRLTACTRCRGASPSRAPTSPGRRCSCAFSQAEAGVGCPISMTYSAIPALRKQPELAAEWEPRFTSLDYDGEPLRPAPDKAGALCGMGMTEKQGGSDVRANTTVATPLNGGGPGGRVRARPATSGSCRRRCATPSSSSPRPTAASPAS